MKKTLKFIILFFFGMLVIAGCVEKEDDTNPVDPDTSLIIAEASTSKYVIVSPTTGAIKAEVQPNVISINQLALGYNSQKAIVTSKEPGGSFIKVIYTCDRETGANLFQVTSELMWDIQSMDASRTTSSIVFHGHPVDGGASTSNIFTINLDGTNVQQLTQNKELVEGIELWWPYFPAFSPNGQKIAFRGNMRTPDPGAYWWGQSIIVMDVNGSNKQILYNEPEANSGSHSDISWTRDGKFLVFLTTEGYSTPNERVKVLRVEDGQIIDITQNLMVDGLHTTNLCTSPIGNTILFNKYEPGGGDLYAIDYTVNVDQFQINGSYRILAAYDTNQTHFGAPDWQVWDGN